MKALRQLMTMSLAVLAVMSISSSAKATCHSSINVTTTVYDYDSSGTQQLLLRSDDYNGTGYATYSAALNANVVSDIYGCTGQWFFELFRQSTGVRTVWITPNDAYSSQPAGPPPGYYWQDVEIVSSCYDANGNVVYPWAITSPEQPRGWSP